MDMASARSLLLPGTHISFQSVEVVPGPSQERCFFEEEITSGHNSPHYSPPNPTLRTPSLLHKDYNRQKSSRRDELRRFRTSLWWWGLDQSTKSNLVFSWFLFIMFTLGVPVLSSLFVTCPRCNEEQSYAYDKIVQIPESTLAAIAFFCLSRYVRRYGLRKFLFLDQLCDDTAKVQQGYTQEVDSSFKLLAWILLPSFLVELLHKILWFMSVTVSIPYIHGQILSSSIMFAAVLVSWIYRTGVFLFVCILFRLTCHLQILRFEGYKNFLEEYSSDVYILLKEHIRIRHQLFLISHRFRVFILASLLTISVSQLMALAMMLSSTSKINFFTAGDLVVCSAVQLTGFLLCLLEAARITHRAQGLVSMATRWHSLSTCSSHGAYYSEKADLPDSFGQNPSSITPFSTANSDNDSESSEIFFMFPSKDAVAAFQMRQSFVTYLKHNSGGITLFGFVLDRGLLYTIFAFEFSLIFDLILT
ncbi:hypothetical protein SUGI_0308680 [Cryptomeria japonica]|uniref:uncharacterized protein LOC131069601 n=1 Tax=Cryptomeria japonica TaxID=3369 RepID=UPI002408CC4F|nr:uncharacterized protein LOC131069601 [Cryptomeria japonica]GLJ17687.1 hypothetical protein SUGI_0308680 [Cryptomeria japonica]